MSKKSVNRTDRKNGFVWYVVIRNGITVIRLIIHGQCPIPPALANGFTRDEHSTRRYLPNGFPQLMTGKTIMWENRTPNNHKVVTSHAQGSPWKPSRTSVPRKCAVYGTAGRLKTFVNTRIDTEGRQRHQQAITVYHLRVTINAPSAETKRAIAPDSVVCSVDAADRLPGLVAPRTFSMPEWPCAVASMLGSM